MVKVGPRLRPRPAGASGDVEGSTATTTEVEEGVGVEPRPDDSPDGSPTGGFPAASATPPPPSATATATATAAHPSAGTSTLNENRLLLLLLLLPEEEEEEEGEEEEPPRPPAAATTARAEPTGSPAADSCAASGAGFLRQTAVTWPGPKPVTGSDQSTPSWKASPAATEAGALSPVTWGLTASTATARGWEDASEGSPVASLAAPAGTATVRVPRGEDGCTVKANDEDAGDDVGDDVVGDDVGAAASQSDARAPGPPAVPPSTRSSGPKPMTGSDQTKATLKGPRAMAPAVVTTPVVAPLTPPLTPPESARRMRTVGGRETRQSQAAEAVRPAASHA